MPQEDSLPVSVWRMEPKDANQMTTDELIAEIERLDQAASPGPWEYTEDGVLQLTDPTVIVGLEVLSCCNMDDPTMELIAAYRTLAVEAAARLREIQNERMEER